MQAITKIVTSKTEPSRKLPIENFTIEAMIRTKTRGFKYCRKKIGQREGSFALVKRFAPNLVSLLLASEADKPCRLVPKADKTSSVDFKCQESILIKSSWIFRFFWPAFPNFSSAVVFPILPSENFGKSVSKSPEISLRILLG